jgi:PAS domain S-box-containing protein
MRPLPSLRQLLLLLAFACVVPMAGMALGLIAYEVQREREQVEADAIGTARALMAAVDDRFLLTQRALLALAGSQSLARGDFAQLQGEAELLRDSVGATSVLLLDAGGRQWMNTERPWGTELPPESLPQVLQAIRSKQPAVIDLFRSPTSQALRVGVGVPAAGAGAALALHAQIDPVLLRDVLARQRLPSGWIAAVLDRSGTIVARTHEHERFSGTRARAALVARIAGVQEDAVESVTVDGVPVVTAFSRSPRSGWSVAIGIPRAELQQPIVRSALLLLLGTGLVMLLTATVAWRMARSLGASVEALGSAVRASGHHAALELPEPTFQEAWQLGIAFAQAQAAVADAHAAFARSEARMRAVLDAAPQAIVTADAQGRIALFNRAAERAFRLDAQDALARPVDSLFPPPAREGLRRLLAQSAPGEVRGIAGGRVFAALRADGTLFRAQASISAVDSDEGRLFTIVLQLVPARAAAPGWAGAAT